MSKTDFKIAASILALPFIGFVIFIVFLNLRLNMVVDWSWFWVWFPLWIPWAVYAVLCGLGCALLTIASGKIDEMR